MSTREVPPGSEGERLVQLSASGEPAAIAADLLDRVHDSIIVCDTSSRVLYWNAASERLYGWTRAEALGTNVHELLKTRAAHGVEQIESEFTSAGEWIGNLQQVTRDGAVVHVTSNWQLQGTAAAPRLLIQRDITAQKNAEAAARQTEERYRRFVEEDLTGDFRFRPDGTILACNRAFVRIFGFSSAEAVLQANFASLLPTKKESARLMAAIAGQGFTEAHELEMLQPRGDAVYVAARFVGSFDEHGELTEVQGYLFNDTRRKRLEQQLIQAQKMEGLGTLAGGIAHDFNNILAIILGYATQLEGRNVRAEHIPGAVKTIKEAVERGAALVQQLLTSARQAEARFASVNLNDLVREMAPMLEATFPKTINFQLHVQPNLPLITADRSQVHQVLLNLCVNARDAMPAGGTISIETSVVSGPEVADHFTGADAAEYARIQIRDTGSGMTAEVRSHIFEPFFTTKERGKGTGLGLSVVYGVINNHRGFVQVESEPRRGTTLSVYLPIARQAEAPRHDDVHGIPAKRQPRTILIVEDEEMLRDLAIQILEGEGYRVLAARDGLEAVELFDRNKAEIGLVLCDLGLPKLGGRDVFMRMKESSPSVRAIVASGYLEPTMRSEIPKAGVIDTIQKPYDFRELVEKIRTVIGAADPVEDDAQVQLF
ncbi:MAG: PAS domain S-box protein [Chthoniobacterales bacterium]|nr:PAS domain S-box protein [Chthoniobacterales bacterium]